MKPLSYKTVADIRLRGLTSWEVIERYRDTEYHDVVFGDEKNLSRKNDKAHILFGYTGKKQKHILGAFVPCYEKREQAGWYYRYHLSSLGIYPFFEKGDFGIFPWNFEWNYIEAMILRGVWYRIGIMDGLYQRFHPESVSAVADFADMAEENVKQLRGQPACWLQRCPEGGVSVLFVDKHVKDQYAVFAADRDSLENGKPSRKLCSVPELKPQSLPSYLQLVLDEYAQKQSISEYFGLTHKQILNSFKKGRGSCPRKSDLLQKASLGLPGTGTWSRTTGKGTPN